MKIKWASFLSESKQTLKEAVSTTFTLFKIMIPISIIIKIISQLGLIEIIGEYLSPAMNIVGLPGEFGLVWATTLITNLYGGLLVFLNLSLTSTYSTGEVTILAMLMLVAHTLPIELRIAQKAGVRLWFMLILRLGCAIIFAWLLNICFSIFPILQDDVVIIWNPGYVDPSLFGWILRELRNYLMIFLIITSLMFLMKILKNLGVIEKLNNFLEPGLERLGMSKNAAPVTIIGITLGISYGGGLIIKETRSKTMSVKDAFLSVSLMGLTHSLIEDTLIMLAMGASLLGILFARILFTIVAMFLLIHLIKRMSKKAFQKYFTSF
jgi:hypothetical protein